MLHVLPFLAVFSIGTTWGATAGPSLVLGGVTCEVFDRVDRRLSLYNCGDEQISVETNADGGTEQISSRSVALYGALADAVTTDKQCKLFAVEVTDGTVQDDAGVRNFKYTTNNYLCNGTKVSLTTVVGPDVFRRNRVVLSKAAR